MKKYDKMFSISLIIIGISNLIIVASNVFEFELPALVIILLGAAVLAAALMLIHSSVKKMV